MKPTHYMFSFVLATLSFIAARSIQLGGVQDYFDQVANRYIEQEGYIDFENQGNATFMPIGIQPPSALVFIDSLNSAFLSQDSTQLFEFDTDMQKFSLIQNWSEDTKIQQIAYLDSSFILLDQNEILHFVNDFSDSNSDDLIALPNDDNLKHLICYHPNLKRLAVLNSSLLENGKRRFECQLVNAKKRKLSQIPLFSIESEELLFEPISVAIHPLSNTFYLLSNQGEVVILNQDGTLQSRQFLPKSITKPKVIAISPNGDLFATDANILHPVVIRLPWQKMIAN